MITQQELDQFCGSGEVYQHWLKAFVYSDGVKYLVEKARAFWLLDAIGSYQPQLLSDPMLQKLQIWTLTVEGKKGRLVCEKDSDIVVVSQKIPYTDFPLPEISLFLVEGVLLLPSEY
jgi:hypothetical protein